MTKKSIISIILALVLCLQTVSLAAAAMLGDADKDGKISASDARIALRASVGLEELDDEAKKAADADLDGEIKAADARLILRASVGLEELKTPEEPAVHPEYHDFKTISVTGETRCSFPGCEAVLPSFNDIVNPLKATGNGVNYFTAVYEDVSHYDEPVLGGSLADMMGEEALPVSTETTYLPLVVNRPVTRMNFHTKETDFVSALTDKDVKSIKIEKADKVDFVSALPTVFNDGKKDYDISAIKGYSFPEIYKITVVLNDDKSDITKPVSGTSVFDKLYTADYNKTLEDMRKQVSSGFDGLAGEMAGLENMLKMKSSGAIISKLTVEYYVTADNFTPVAAKYSHGFDVSFEIAVTTTADLLWVAPMLTMLQKMNMKSNSYYFFNNSFGM